MIYTINSSAAHTMLIIFSIRAVLYALSDSVVFGFFYRTIVHACHLSVLKHIILLGSFSVPPQDIASIERLSTVSTSESVGLMFLLGLVRIHYVSWHVNTYTSVVAS